MPLSSDPPSDGDDAIRAALYRAAAEAVVFKHRFPPRFPIASRTFFGGLPTVPDEFCWPRAPGGTPYTFMAQIDCADLPDFQLRDLLPSSGVLHFFVDWEIFEGFDEAQTSPDQVVFSPSRTTPLQEASAPADLPPCYGAGNAGHYFPWLEHADRRTRDYPRSFPKKAMTMGKLRTFAENYPGKAVGNTEERYRQMRTQEQGAELTRVHGEPVVAKAMAKPRTDYSPRPPVQRPTTTFPAAWIDVEIFCGLLLKEVQERGLRSLERFKDATGPADPAHLRAGYEAAMSNAREWMERARAGGLMGPAAEAERTAFWSWLDGMNAVAIDKISDSRAAYTLDRLTWAAVRTGAFICLSDSEAAASLVPEEVMGEVRMAHSVFASVLPEGPTGEVRVWPRRAGHHQMIGFGSNVQEQASVRAMETGDVLLMQLDTDYAVPWMMADGGVLQYWIAVADLRAQRFDRVRVTVEGH